MNTTDTTDTLHYEWVVWADHNRQHVTLTCGHAHRTAETAHDCWDRANRASARSWGQSGGIVAGSGLAECIHPGRGTSAYRPLRDAQ